MKRLPQLTSLIAVVALSVSLAYWAMQLFKAPQRPINPPAVPVVQDARVEAGASLFGGQVSVASVSNYQLRGVVAAGNGRGSVAIISTDGKPSVALPAGAEVAPGVTVKEVQPRYVVLLDGGVSKRLELLADDKALSLPGTVGPVPGLQQPAPSLVPPPMPAEAQQRPGGVLMPAAGGVVSQPQPATPPTN
ncbi:MULTISPECIES: type II secretion system protein N [unclassified Janthinobacterium]|jgi:general secretion pathway protein C|uniref:type II secretion system protein N n=1 Tax=unclassified Janthinobacterium TaxID=2610881 RepID=UPI001616064B|nr:MULTISPECIES: type II secretion system protein N [unclassified Janthinobacterium]MBB5605742.1 general secretion pathway protein C [Janthinobacterium sp. S3T4]MBB5611339.1 general secretion pathway protein C [Janthinobacterium sp. S3M3]